MPIISDISSLGNVILKIYEILSEKPYLGVIFIIFILFFPLNILDFLIYILINIFIAIFNVLSWVIIIPVNLLIYFLEVIVNGVIATLYFPINFVITLLSGSAITAPITTIPNIPYFNLSYIPIDFFGDQDTIIGFIVDSSGLSFPLWTIKYLKYYSYKVY